MIAWGLAAVAALVAGWLAYGRLPAAAGRDTARPPARGPLALLLAATRGLAVGLLVAVLLGATAGRRPPLPPLVAIDVSESWRRTAPADADARWTAARAAADGVDSVLLVGDSARLVEGSVVAALDRPDDAHSLLRPAVDRALALGRPLRLVTDGEGDADALRSQLPPGSQLVVPAPPDGADVAIADLQLPDFAAGGDTITVDVSLQAARRGAPARTLRVRVGDAAPVARSIPALAPWETRTERVALVVPRGDAERSVVTWLAPVAPGEGSANGDAGAAATTGPLGSAGTGGAATGPDVVARNDTLIGRLVVRDAPRVVFVSTAPDLDVREALRVLRGTGAAGTRAYLRIAPGQWRVEGTLARVDEAEVRARAAGAELLVVHGDTDWAAGSRGGQARVHWRPAPPPAPPRAGVLPPVDEWYVDPPVPSPLGDALAALPVDSLAPIALGSASTTGGPTGTDVAGRSAGAPVADSTTAVPPARAVTALAVRLRRGGEPVPVLQLDELGRARRAWLRGSGWAAWALRDDRGRAAFDALLGAIFDWAGSGAQAGDEPVLLARVLRRGDALIWRRGADSLSVVRVTPVGGGTAESGAIDSLVLRFPGGAREVTAPSLPEGTWALEVGARRTVVVVNPSREWVPTVPAGEASRVATSDSAPAPTLAAASGPARPLREASWPLVAALLLLCAEWIGRRAAGLR